MNKLRGMRYVVVLLGLFFSQVASACPVCIGNANDPMVRSANNGVVFLAILTGIVLVPFAGSMIYWGLRSRRLEKLRPSL
ncbi:MAG: hypothetical protein HYR96_02395 [Deltaproteobacteria bacterium]|nr:hypothetical protein [Deltaproteobacteria bacterium]